MTQDERRAEIRRLIKLTYTRHWSYLPDTCPVSTAEYLAELVDFELFDGVVGEDDDL